MEQKEEITNLKYEVKGLKEKTSDMEKRNEKADEILEEIRGGLASIKQALVEGKEQEDLKIQLLKKDIDGMKERIEKLEANQRWLIMSVIGEVLAIIFGIIMMVIEKGI